jgi:hypothetical protein
MNIHKTGILLVSAFVIFLTGAGFWLVREFEQPLPVRLRAVDARSRRWMWIHAWMLAGTVTSLWAVGSLVRILRADNGGRLATIGFAAFATGCLAMLASLAFGLTATPRGSLFPAWLGWTGVVSGAVGFVGFVVGHGGPFGPPIIAHAFGLLVGIVILLRH